MKLDYLLSDEFVQFSQKIARLVEAKKALKKELKEFYEGIQAKIAVLENEAKALEAEFDAWKRGQAEETVEAQAAPVEVEEPKEETKDE
jgi:uncharacterized protein Yka (UPF0111/DUF47 family)